MALLYNVLPTSGIYESIFFERNGANPCSIPKNFIDLSNSWSVASYIYDPLHPNPPPQKKNFKNSNNNYDNNNKPNCPCNNHRKLSQLLCFNLFLTLTPLRFSILSGFLGFCIIFIANPHIEQLTIYPADAQPGDCIYQSLESTTS